MACAIGRSVTTYSIDFSFRNNLTYHKNGSKFILKTIFKQHLQEGDLKQHLQTTYLAKQYLLQTHATKKHLHSKIEM